MQVMNVAEVENHKRTVGKENVRVSRQIETNVDNEEDQNGFTGLKNCCTGRLIQFRALKWV